MKIFAVHSNTGKIKYLGIPSKGFDGQTGLLVEDTENVSEIDDPDLEGDLASPRNQAHLSDLVQNHHVKIVGKKATLVRTK